MRQHGAGEGLPERAAGLALSRAAASGFRALLDLVLPPQCLACTEPALDDGALCARCWAALCIIDRPRCDVLGRPFAFDHGEGALSPEALADPPPWDRARGAVAFDEHARRIVHALKYGDRHETAKLMARMMAVAGRDVIADADVILPVPLYRWRLWKRRYNQAALLAGRLARSSGKRMLPQGLDRVRPTRSQVGLGHEARTRNVRGAFAVAHERAGDIAGRRVLLVDDVLTTGATAAACSKALKAAGARAVDVLVFALVLEPTRLHM